MDQIKIGKFISENRKEKNLTQMQLAEALGVTDRAVSKWENGRSMPDSSIIIELCNLLGITATELLLGEKIEMEESKKSLEKMSLEIIKEKEKTDRAMLKVEVVLGVVSTLFLLGLILLAGLIEMETWLRITLIISSFALWLVAIFFAVRIEQIAGYYECKKCSFQYAPSYNAVLWSMHMGRTRYMKCPKCGKKSWQRKVVERKK